jgi:curli biogenesis system outer membrane secretion channel CsgG
MKRLLTAVVLVAASASVSAFAQSSPPATIAAQGQSVAVSTPTEQWTSPYGQSAQQKTRAQVYQDLVHAEKDGQIRYLNSTVYAGS